MQYVCAALFFLLTALYGVLAGCDRASDVERSAKDEQEWEDYVAKQEFKSNPGLFFVNKLKEKSKQAENTMKSVTKAD